MFMQQTTPTDKMWVKIQKLVFELQNRNERENYQEMAKGTFLYCHSQATEEKVIIMSQNIITILVTAIESAIIVQYNVHNMLS